MIPPPPVDDRRVSRALGTSVLLRAADRLVDGVWQATKSARAAKLFSQGTRYWWGLAPADRLTATGVGLLVASALHIGLLVTHEIPAGWLWLVPPAAAATSGLVSLVVRNPSRGTN